MNPDNPPFSLELEIDTTPEKVFDAMLNHLTSWWPKDFVGLEGSEMVFEPFAGGRLFERHSDGSSLLWSHVVMVKQGEYIDLAGPVTPAFGGPSLNFVRMAVSREGGKTLFRLTNTVFGVSGDPASVESGWAYLFGSLKEYCEKGVA